MIAARKGTEPGLQTHSGFFSVNVQCAGIEHAARIGKTARVTVRMNFFQ
jgi:hypothetical protein